MNSTRLCYEELVYLCVSLTQAKEIYGLTPKSMDAQINWLEIRDGLIQKEMLTKNQDLLQIHPQLAYMISAISNPKLFISISTSTDNQTHCFYLVRHFAVGLVKDKNTEDQYLLSPYNTPEEIYQALDSIIMWEPSLHIPSVHSATFAIDEFEAYLKSLRQQDRATHDAILAGHGFSADCVLDVFDSLSKKKHWITMVMLSFDPKSTDGKHVAEQTVIYKGDKHLWDMEINQGGTRLFCTNKETMSRKLEIIASLFKYF